jgi:hypothetical protein
VGRLGERRTAARARRRGHERGPGVVAPAGTLRAMRVRVVWWELGGSETSIAELRQYLRDESVDAFGAVEGLRLKLWIADEERNRWGAVYLWESDEAGRQRLPSRARQIIGKDPDFEEWFDLQASVEGVFSEALLSRRGAAFAGA